MAPVKPMLSDIELQLVQDIEVDSDQALVQHSVSAREGDLLQGLDRRAAGITLCGILTGPDAGQRLKELREKFRAAEPVPFAADIATATRVDRVLIVEMEVRELAGRPERFEYVLMLREHMEPSRPAEAEAEPVNQAAAGDAAESQEAITKQIDSRQGTLEVTVEPSEPGEDLSGVQILVQGQTEDGQDYEVVLDEQTDGVFRKTDMPTGQYTITPLSK